VPPDYFSSDGQLWGHPLYDWERMAETGFRWWAERLSTQLRRFDLIRLDHFRAFESHWAVPAAAKTARDGRWVETPGDALFRALADQLGSLPFVAEDLGMITPEVTALRDRFGLPGLIVLQFAFDGSTENPYLPVNHIENAVVYTGTHDNDTTLGWYAGLGSETRHYVTEVLGDGGTMPEALILAAYRSPARLSVVPMQDLLALGAEARLNVPGTAKGNWRWRFEWEQVDAGLAGRYAELARRNGRL
jgi:4-alpha-glucanotransferase